MDPKEFGSFIQARRKQLRLKQSDLAQILNVTDKAVSRWERGIGFPDIKLLEPLAEALEVSLAELMHCQILDEPISEDDTQALLDAHQSISRKRKLLLWTGKIVIFLAEFFLLRVTREQTWDPEWLRYAVYGIALTGGFWGIRAFEYIVGQLYRKKRPWGIWHAWQTWVWAAMLMTGAQILVRCWTWSDPWRVMGMIGGSALLIGELLFYAYHENEINGT